MQLIICFNYNNMIGVNVIESADLTVRLRFLLKFTGWVSLADNSFAEYVGPSDVIEQRALCRCLIILPLATFIQSQSVCIFLT